MSSNRFQGKVVAITGGNSGIGLAAVKAFADQGAAVAFMGRDQVTLNETSSQLKGKHLSFRGDVTSHDDLKQFFTAIASQFGSIDTLFVNAGISKTSSIEETSEAFFDETFNTNVKGAFFTVKYALPYFKDKGSIVFTTSIVSHLGAAQGSIYSSSKAAVRSLVQCFAAELLPRNIRVNSVSPGPIETPIIARSGMGNDRAEAVKNHLKTLIPMRRLGLPEEVANAVLFMASDEASFTTGSELMVDGGWTEMR